MKIFSMRPFFVCIGLLSLSACNNQQPSLKYTGYVEAEYFYIAAPESGWITTFDKKVGDNIVQDEIIATLDNTYQVLNQKEWQAKLSQANAQLHNLQRGARTDEIAIIENKLNEVKQNKKLADLELERIDHLFSKGLTSQAELDKAQYYQQALAFEIASLVSQISVAKLPARENVIVSAEQDVNAVNAALQKATWQLAQRTVLARNNGIVDQVFYRQGEFINQGQPMMSVLIPESKKVRFYLSQQASTHVKIGDIVQVSSDGVSQPFSAKISYISKHTEFTPPVLYGKDARDSLVFLVEAQFEQGVTLHKGQPVDVKLND